MKSYEVIEYSDCMWVRKVGDDNPICYFQGVGERQKYLANRAAGLLGVGLSHLRQGRYERVRQQWEMVRDLPGVKMWEHE